MPAENGEKHGQTASRFSMRTNTMIQRPTKDEAAAHLVGIGYNAENQKGVVTVLTPKPLRRGQKDRIRNELRAINYRGSWGWRMNKEVHNGAEV